VINPVAKPVEKIIKFKISFPLKLKEAIFSIALII
jgi:hypothetical protein